MSNAATRQNSATVELSSDLFIRIPAVPDFVFARSLGSQTAESCPIVNEYYMANQNRYPFSMTTLSKSVDALISDGLLERREQGPYKRIAEVMMTLDGQALKKRILMFYEHVMCLFWGAIGTDLQQAFLEDVSKRRNKMKLWLDQVQPVHAQKGRRSNSRKNQTLT